MAHSPSFISRLLKKEKCDKKKKKRRDKQKWIAKTLILENPGIDPGTSRMQSGRSTI